MLTLALVGTALATGPVAELSNLMDQEPRPGWAVACSPVSDIVDLLKEMPLDDGRPKAAWGDNQRMLIPLLEEGALDKAGINGDGPLIISGHSKRGKIGNSDVLAQFSIPFSGTAEQAQSLISTIEPKTTPVGPGVWTATRAEENLTIRQTESAIVVSSDKGEPNQVAPIATLMTGLPDTPGCAVFALIEGMDPATQMKSKRLKLQGMSMFFPTQGGAAHLRLKTGLSLDADLDGAEIETLLGSSYQSPSATVLWAMDPLDLISAVITILPPIGPVKQLRETLSEEELPIQIPPGMVTVSFESGDQKGVGAVIPVHSRKGKKIWAGTLAKGLRNLLTELKAPVKKVSRTRLTVGKTPEKTIHIATKRGLVYLATTPELLEEMLSGEGKPWVSTALQEMAKTAALAAEVDMPPSETAPAMNLRAGLSLKEGLWEVQAQLDVPAAKSNRLADIWSTVLSLNPKLNDKIAKDLPGAGPEQELTHNVELLATAVNKYSLEHDKLLAAKPWPRAVADLTPDAVPWQAKRKKSKDFAKLNWAPDSDVKGTYWVEVDEDKKAFTVFGAMDADGDGVPVIYKWCHNCESDKPAEVQRVTEPGVY